MPEPRRIETSNPPQDTKCRIFGIVARSSPYVLIFRRGPTAWFHLLRWRTDKDKLEPGVWVRKRLYTELCDFSDDGMYLTYALGTARGGSYHLQVGLSKGPPHDRLHTQHNWEEGVPFCSGWYFQDGRHEHFVLDLLKKLRLDGRNFTLAAGNLAPYAHLRRRGWLLQSPELFGKSLWTNTPPYPHTLTKPGPEKSATLRQDFERPCRSSTNLTCQYKLLNNDQVTETLPEALWADWSFDGRLLTATHTGKLLAFSVRNGRRTRCLAEHDLNELRPSSLPRSSPPPPPSSTAGRPPRPSRSREDAQS